MEKNKAQELSKDQPRRDFLSRLLGGWAILGLLPVINVVVRFLTPAKNINVSESIQVDTLAEISPNSARIVRFGKEPVIIVHTAAGQFKAFFARCTHLGCVVKFEGEETPHFIVIVMAATSISPGRTSRGRPPSLSSH